MRSVLACVFGGWMLAAGPAFGGERPVIDGVFREWSGVTPNATDPSGDGTGNFDLIESKLQSRGTALFLQVTFVNAFNLPDGPASDTDLRVSIRRLPSGSQLTFGFREKIPKLDGTSMSWRPLAFTSAPTTASDRMEMRIDLANLGVTVGDTVRVEFSGADAFGAPIDFTLTEPALDLPRRTWTRADCTQLRVASLNTHETGLRDTQVVQALSRLVDAADADVYLFQEEYSSSAAELTSLMNAIDPKEDAIPWAVVKSGELAIASQWPMIPVSLNGRHFASLIRVPEGPDTFVINVHPNCCGYIGESRDVTRIDLATDAIADVAKLRSGTLAPELVPYANAPVIIGGDWNLVGSSTPRDLWQVPPTGLSNVALRHLIGDDHWTWNNFDRPWSIGGFWPGLLDFFMVQRPQLFPRGGFVLDTRDLNTTELAALGLQAADSGASDHLLLVLDLGRIPRADFSGDGIVTDDDFQVFAAAYNILDCADLAMAYGCPADLNADGVVDDEDFQFFVIAYDELVCP